MLCPRCQLHCAAGRSRCSECGFKFAAPRRGSGLNDDLARVTLIEGEVQKVQAAGVALEDAGIDFWILKRRASQRTPHAPLAKVEVCLEDEDAAREALADAR